MKIQKLKSLGLSLTPENSDRHPILKDWPNISLDDEELLHAPFIAIIPGQRSGGIVVFDVDGVNESNETEMSLLRWLFGSSISELPEKTRVERTPHSGFHVYFKSSPEQLSRLKKIQLKLNFQPNNFGKSFAIEFFPDSSHAVTFYQPINPETEFTFGAFNMEIFEKLLFIASKTPQAQIIRLMLPLWHSGERHNLSLGLAAFLRYRGWNKKQTEELIEKIVQITDDEERASRLNDIRTTFENQNSSYRDFLPTEVVNQLNEIFASDKNKFSNNNNEELPADVFDDDGKLNKQKFAAWIAEREGFVYDVDKNLFLHYNASEGLWQPDAESVIDGYLHRYAEEYVSRNFRGDVILWLQTLNSQKHEIFEQSFKSGLVPLKNGILNVNTFELREYRPKDYFVFQLPISWPSEMKVPETILKAVLDYSKPDPKLFISLLEILSWPLLPYYSPKKAVVLIGEHDTGKSTFLKIFDLIYGSKVAHETLSSLTSDQFSLIKISDKLANIRPELPRSSLSYEASELFKALVGRDVLSVRIMYSQRQFTFENRAKLIFASNFMPVADENYDDDAYYRRFQILKFENPLETEDSQIIDKIAAEVDYLFPILAAIYRVRLSQGHFSYEQTIDEVKNLYDEASARVLDRFSRQWLTFDSSYEGTLSEEVYLKLKEYCEQEGEAVPTLNATGRYIKSHYPVGISQKKTKLLYVGLKIADSPIEISKNVENSDFLTEVEAYLQSIKPIFTKTSYTSSASQLIDDMIKYIRSLSEKRLNRLNSSEINNNSSSITLISMETALNPISSPFENSQNSQNPSFSASSGLSASSVPLTKSMSQGNDNNTSSPQPQPTFAEVIDVEDGLMAKLKTDEWVEWKAGEVRNIDEFDKKWLELAKSNGKIQTVNAQGNVVPAVIAEKRGERI